MIGLVSILGLGKIQARVSLFVSISPIGHVAGDRFPWGFDMEQSNFSQSSIHCSSSFKCKAYFPQKNQVRVMIKLVLVS